MKDTIKRGTLRPRNPHAVAARARRAGALKDRRTKRQADKDRREIAREASE